jgi:HlyD family secretion protein
MITKGGGQAERERGNAGSQGAELIFELQRVQRALEHELALSQAHASVLPQARRPAGVHQRQLDRSDARGRQSSAVPLDIDRGPPFTLHTASVRSDLSSRRSAVHTAPPPRIANRDRARSAASATAMQRGLVAGERIVVAQLTSLLSDGRKLLAVLPRLSPARLRALAIAGAAFLSGRTVVVSDTTTDTLATRLGRAFEQELRNGLRVLLVVGGLAAVWMVAVPLAAAVIVPGNLVVQSNVKSIQHPTGGVVAEIAVHDGVHVKAGDLLVRLDATQARASLRMVSKQLDEVRLRVARLTAERDGATQVDLPPGFASRSHDEEVRLLLASERTLFNARANSLQSQRELLQSRISQLGEENAGVDAQLASKASQLDLISSELSGVQELFDKRLVPLARLTALQRDAARIEGERGQLVSAGAEIKSKISEAKLQIVRVAQDFRTDVVKELGEAQAKEAELVERGVAAQDLLERIEMHAPASGVVHKLALHTVGGVIRAGDSVMEIVPDTDELQVEARLQPSDIDQVSTGQKAFVRFSAFNQRTTPELAGLVSYVSADVSHDQQTNAPYFTVRVILPDDERRKLAGLQLISGMPAEVFMQTGSRSMMSYLLKPLADQVRRAFIER